MDSRSSKSPGRKSRRPPDGPDDFEAGFNDFNQLALWTAATLAGMATSMLLSRGPFFRKLMARLYPQRRPINFDSRPSHAEALPMLADAIIGSPRETILSVFGPPRSAAINDNIDPVQSSYWRACTWYYPLHRQGRMAMAILFENDLARAVDFFCAPRTRQN
jgi:hypothetical protein